ncbi:MAG: polyisoprenoid-binding protein [Chitinophagales bacterium]|nr:MAG: polyisoprenoid-binding protein [Chitinophagales bacterium]
MKQVFFYLALFCGLTGVMQAQSTKWVFDKSHSKIGFEATHMVISKVQGNFTSYEGTVLSDKPDFTDAKIDFTIDVASINTENEQRDNHLRSDDFFNAEKYPKITFKGKSLKKVSDNQYKLSGDLTIRDVTKPVELDVTYGGTVKDPWGNTRAGFHVKGVIDRFDYNLKWNAALETGGLVVGREIVINCPIELIRQ